MVAIDPLLIARCYQETRQRIVDVVTTLDQAGLSTSVAACPVWTVRDVLAHLAAVAQDVASGRLTGRPPTDDETAAQVERFANHDLAALLAAWAEAAERLDGLAESARLELPLGDVTSHEHDIRGSVGRHGARDSPAVWHSSDKLLANLRTPVPTRVTVEDGEYRSGPEGRIEICLRTSRFEALRWRTGRRSRVQLAAMDWTGDPAPVLDRLFLFGPAEVDLVE